MAAGMAEGTAFRPESHANAAVLGASSHQVVLEALDPPSNPSERPAHHEEMYTERELRRDWTEARQGNDEGRR